ncbi:MAG: DoxX family protein, partial [Gammaproteobacteria bacterium]
MKTQIVVTMRRFEFLAPLMLRLYLAPIFIAVGLHKATHFGDIVSWFGNAVWGLGLPFPVVMAFLATVTEIGGGFCLLFGLANRLLSVPLMITMIIAIVTVHGEKGWFAIAPSDPEASVARVLAPIGFPG